MTAPRTPGSPSTRTRASPMRSTRCAWIDANVPRPWIDAGRSGGAAAVRTVRRRASTKPGTRCSRRRVSSRPRGRWRTPGSISRRRSPRRAGARAVQPRAAEPARPQPRGARAVRARHRGAAPAVPPADRAQRRSVVPAVQRAGRGLRSRVARTRGPRRRPLDRQRSEGVDHVGAPRRLRGAARRTDADVPKRQGITYFLVDLHQPGVEVRPLRHIGGEVDFNEVFLDDAVVPDDATSAPSATDGRSPTRRSRASGRWCRDPAPVASIASAGSAPTICSSSRAGRVGIGDPVVRQELMRVFSEERIRDWTNQRVRAQVKAGRAPGPESSIGKVHQGGLNQRVQLLATALLGMDAIAWTGESPPAKCADAAQPRQHDRGRHDRGQQERGRRARARPPARARPVAPRRGARRPIDGERRLMTYETLVVERQGCGRLVGVQPPGRGPTR